MLQLVRPAPSADTIACLEAMLAHARSGEVVGLTYVVRLRGGRSIANACGDAKASPMLALGMAKALELVTREQLGL